MRLEGVIRFVDIFPEFMELISSFASPTADFTVKIMFSARDAWGSAESCSSNSIVYNLASMVCLLSLVVSCASMVLSATASFLSCSFLALRFSMVGGIDRGWLIIGSVSKILGLGRSRSELRGV